MIWGIVGEVKFCFNWFIKSENTLEHHNVNHFRRIPYFIIFLYGFTFYMKLYILKCFSQISNNDNSNLYLLAPYHVPGIVLSSLHLLVHLKMC